MRLFALMFLMIAGEARAAGGAFELWGTVLIRGADDSPVCELCAGCSHFSGGVKRPLECAEGDFLNGVKYRLQVLPVRVGGKCVLRSVGPREALGPEIRMPLYPDQKELETMTGCGG